MDVQFALNVEAWAKFLAAGPGILIVFALLSLIDW